MSQCSDSIILLTFKQYILNALQYHAHRTFLAGYLCEKTAQRTAISEHQISHVPFLLPHHLSLTFSFVLSLHIIPFHTHFLTKMLLAVLTPAIHVTFPFHISLIHYIIQ